MATVKVMKSRGRMETMWASQHRGIRHHSPGANKDPSDKESTSAG
jgi:hypothetical protein